MAYDAVMELFIKIFRLIGWMILKCPLWAVICLLILGVILLTKYSGRSPPDDDEIIRMIRMRRYAEEDILDMPEVPPRPNAPQPRPPLYQQPRNRFEFGHASLAPVRRDLNQTPPPLGRPRDFTDIPEPVTHHFVDFYQPPEPATCRSDLTETPESVTPRPDDPNQLPEPATSISDLESFESIVHSLSVLNQPAEPVTCPFDLLQSTESVVDLNQSSEQVTPRSDLDQLEALVRCLSELNDEPAEPVTCPVDLQQSIESVVHLNQPSEQVTQRSDLNLSSELVTRGSDLNQPSESVTERGDLNQLAEPFTSQSEIDKPPVITVVRRRRGNQPTEPVTEGSDLNAP